MAVTVADFPAKVVTDDWWKLSDVIAYFKAEAGDITAIIEELGGTNEDDLAILAAIDPTFCEGGDRALGPHIERKTNARHAGGLRVQRGARRHGPGHRRPHPRAAPSS